MADHTDPDEIQREIERTRADLAETIDAIAEKVSPKRVVARTADRVRTAVKGDGRPQVMVGGSGGATALGGSSDAATAADRHEEQARATGLPAEGSARYTIQRRLRTDRVLVAAGVLVVVVATVVLARRRTREDYDYDFRF